MFLLSPNLPTAAAILFLCLSCQQFSSDWLSLVSIVFEPIRTHLLFALVLQNFELVLRKICTSFSANQN